MHVFRKIINYVGIPSRNSSTCVKKKLWFSLIQRIETPQVSHNMGCGLKTGFFLAIVATVRGDTSTSSSLPSSTKSASGTSAHLSAGEKPNIMLVLVDDQGHGDIELSDTSDFSTPTLKTISEEGIKFANFYSGATCTPSRAMLMTGRYTIRYGFQDSVIHSTEPRGVSLTETFLPEKLKRVGYETIMIGKW